MQEDYSGDYYSTLDILDGGIGLGTTLLFFGAFITPFFPLVGIPLLAVGGTLTVVCGGVKINNWRNERNQKQMEIANEQPNTMINLHVIFKSNEESEYISDFEKSNTETKFLESKTPIKVFDNKNMEQNSMLQQEDNKKKISHN